MVPNAAMKKVWPQGKSKSFCERSEGIKETKKEKFFKQITK